jgi:molybdopterin-guanine dinucleotide biosynthesis protein A
VYAKDALPELEAALKEGRLSPTDIVGRLNNRIIPSEEWGVADPSSRFAFNINTEHDLDLM